MADTSANVRYHALDAVRGFAMLLGVFLHAALAYLEHTPADWPSDPEVAFLPLDLMMFWIHAFRMEAFFLMAGFFGALVTHKRGLRSFVLHRTRRVIIPFLVGFVILSPSVAWLAKYGVARLDLSRTHDAAVATAAEHFRSGAYLAAASTEHLWFLQYLILHYTAAVALCSVADRPWAKLTTRRIDEALDRLLASRLRVFALALPTIVLLATMDNSYVDTPIGLVPHPHIVAYYGLFFALGWFMFRRRRWLEQPLGPWGDVAVALLVIGPALAAQWAVNIEGHRDQLLAWLAAHATYAVLTWSTVWAVVGLALHYLHGDSPRIRYLADSSYWIYLAHLPVVLALQAGLPGLGVPAPLRFPTVVIATTLVLLVLYRYAVRHTFIGRTLNGERRRQ